MSKGMKRLLVIAAALVVLGSGIVAAVMTEYDWDFSKLSTVKYETSTYQVSKAFNGISIHTDTADILFAASEDSTCRVVCHEQEKLKHSVAVDDGVLSIETVDDRQWYEYIGISIGSPKITVYLPETEYESLLVRESTGSVALPRGFHFEKMDIAASTGDIHVEGVSAGEMALSVSTGKVTVTDVDCEGDIRVDVSTGKTNMVNVECENLTSNGDTGDLTMKNVIAAQMFTVERDTGDVRFDACDASELLIRTDTGDVTGSLLTDKVFIAQTDTGRVDVPRTTTGGKCEVTSSTGDIDLTIQ